MEDDNWRKEIPKVRKFIREYMKEHDLEWSYV